MAHRPRQDRLRLKRFHCAISALAFQNFRSWTASSHSESLGGLKAKAVHKEPLTLDKQCASLGWQSSLMCHKCCSNPTACPVLAMADSCRHPRASSLGACMCRRCFNPTASLSTFGSRAAGRRRWLRPTHRPSGACSQKLAGFGKHDHGTPSQVSGYLGLSESDLSSVICLFLVFLPICGHKKGFLPMHLKGGVSVDENSFSRRWHLRVVAHPTSAGQRFLMSLHGT